MLPMIGQCRRIYLMTGQATELIEECAGYGIEHLKGLGYR
jgi:hypothetical protein